MKQLLKKWELEDATITMSKTDKCSYSVIYIQMVTPKKYAEKNKDDYFVENCPEFYTDNTQKTEREIDCRTYGSRNAAMNHIRKLLKSKRSE